LLLHNHIFLFRLSKLICGFNFHRVCCVFLLSKVSRLNEIVCAPGEFSNRQRRKQGWRDRAANNIAPRMPKATPL
jgi:hypothetical protein